jgi:hypothetical protein
MGKATSTIEKANARGFRQSLGGGVEQNLLKKKKRGNKRKAEEDWGS